MRSKSTELMDKIIEYIDNKYFSEGYVPSVREIAAALEVSKSCVSSYLSEMESKGMIEKSDRWHGLKTNSIKKVNTEVEYLPVVGAVACGNLRYAIENIESYLPIPKSFLGPGKHHILVARGDSMINAGINDGDLVIIKEQDYANEGDIVVALVDYDASLKRYYIDRKRRKIRLHPENEKYEDMYYDNVRIQGVAIKIIKDIE